MSDKNENAQAQNNPGNELKRENIVSKDDVKVIYPFKVEETLDGNKVFIECHGATVYDPDTRQVIAGVEFIEENSGEQGYRIVDREVYAPEHCNRRLIKKDHQSSIRRCQACQDLTVRLMRREGVDFFIPSPKHPKKTKLKSIEQTW